MADNLYDKLGASASKAGLHKALKSAGAAPHSSLFAVVNEDIAGDEQYLSFIHCDGAGTKSIVAYLLSKATGDLSHYAGLAQDALVMNLDDIYCLGAPSSLLVANTIARNARIIDDEVIAQLVGRYRLLVENLNKHGIPISLSGGETADMGDVVRSLVVDAVVAGRIAKKGLIDTKHIAPGDVILGLASSGQSTYEDTFNSGIGSNGLTLARHALLKRAYADAEADIVDRAGITDASYSGPFDVTDTPEELNGMSVGEALLSPTRTFAPLLQNIYESFPGKVHAAIHVTGGGLTKVLRFGPGGLKFVKDNLFEPPAIFRLVQQHGGVSWREMYEVFNMGQRIELYISPEAAESIMAEASKMKIDAKLIGRVEKSNNNSNSVLVRSSHGEFEYSEN